MVSAGICDMDGEQSDGMSMPSSSAARRCIGRGEDVLREGEVVEEVVRDEDVEAGLGGELVGDAVMGRGAVRVQT